MTSEGDRDRGHGRGRGSGRRRGQNQPYQESLLTCDDMHAFHNAYDFVSHIYIFLVIYECIILINKLQLYCIQPGL